MLEVICIADPHFGAYKFLENYQNDTDGPIYQAVQSVADYAKDNGVEHLIILGDIFNYPNPEQEEQKRLLRFLKNLDLNIYMIFGNHDYSSIDKHSLIMSEFFSNELFDKIHIFTKPSLIKINKIPFSMLPWPYAKPITKKPSINCAHVTIKGSKADSGKTLAKGEELKKYPNQHWIIGDLHTRQKHYPGTLLQLNFGESLPKGFTHLKIRFKSNNLIVKEEWISRKPEFELITLRIDSLEDLNKIEPYNKNDLKLYKLKVAQDVILPVNIREIYSHIYNISYEGKEKIVDTKTKNVIKIYDMIDPLKGLRRFMMKEGLTIEETRQGYKYVKEKYKRIIGD